MANYPTREARLRIPVTDEGVDGMTRDCAGNLYVTTGNRVLVLDPEDEVLGALTLPHNPTNVEFGGAKGQTLFITTLETTIDGVVSKPSLYAADWDAPVSAPPIPVAY